MQEEKIKGILIEKNNDFRVLSNEHRECEQQLIELRASNIKTDNQHNMEKTLKRRKLHLKDTMEKLIADYRSQAAVK